MVFSLTEFLNKIGAGARSSNFELQIQPRDAGQVLLNSARILVKNTTFPTLTLNKTVVNHHGFPTNIYLDRPILEWTATFFCDENMELHSNFVNWQRQFRDIDPERNNMSRPEFSDPASITIIQKDITLEKDLRTMTILNAVPINISEISLSKDNININEFTVTFAYSGIEDAESK